MDSPRANVHQWRFEEIRKAGFNSEFGVCDGFVMRKGNDLNYEY